MSHLDHPINIKPPSLSRGGAARYPLVLAALKCFVTKRRLGFRFTCTTGLIDHDMSATYISVATHRHATWLDLAASIEETCGLTVKAAKNEAELIDFPEFGFRGIHARYGMS